MGTSTIHFVEDILTRFPCRWIWIGQPVVRCSLGSMFSFGQRTSPTMRHLMGGIWPASVGSPGRTLLPISQALTGAVPFRRMQINNTMNRCIMGISNLHKDTKTDGYKSYHRCSIV